MKRKINNNYCLFPDLSTELIEIRKNTKKENKIKQKILDCSICDLKNSFIKEKKEKHNINTNNIMIINDFPDKEGNSLSKEHRFFLQRILAKSKIDLDLCYITNAVKCYPEKEILTNKQILCCNEKLQQEILQVKPKLIIVLGKDALYSILQETCSIEAYRGWLIPSKKYNCIIFPIFHPKEILMDYLAKFYATEKDLQKLLNFKDISQYDLNTYEENNKILNTTEEIMEYIIQPIKQKTPYCFDIETNMLKPYNSNSKILICGVAFNGKQSYTFEVNEQNINLFKFLYENNTKKIIYNFKFEQLWGIVKAKTSEINIDTLEDVLLMSYILDERNKTHSLDFQLKVRLGIYKLEEVKKYIKNIEECPKELLHKYCGLDCKSTFRLYEVLSKELENFPNLKNVYRNILLKVSLATLRSEISGVVIDWEKLENLNKYYKQEIKQIIYKLYSLPDVKQYKDKYGKFNFKSPKDISNFLKEKYGKESLRKTIKNNFSVDSNTLQELIKQKQCVFSNLLLQYRDLIKVKSTYIDGLLKVKQEDNKIHTDYLVHGTETGRLSSTNPNLQNITKHKHNEIRKCFIAPEGKVIMSFDYSGAEICGIAMVSNDKKLNQELKEKENIHGKWAKKLFNLQEENINWHDKVYKEKRYIAKNKFFFPLCYGSYYKTIAENLEMSEEFIKQLQEEFFLTYSGIKNYHNEALKEYKEKGYITTFFGRIRHAPLSYNQIINTKIQSLMGDFTLLSLIVLSNMNFEIPLNIHDDLTFYIEYDKIEEAYKTITKVMTGWNFPFMTIPLEVECSIGLNWGEQIDYQTFINLLKQQKEGSLKEKIEKIFKKE